jgi:hypothetical protein
MAVVSFCSHAACAESEGQKLFREGKLALANGLYEEACAKFEQSYKVEGAVGPLLNQADCEERRGKLMKALSLWKQGAQKATSSEDQSFIAGRVSSLEGRIPSVTFELGEGVPPDSKVTLDDAPIELGKNISVDPGEHALVAKSGDKIVVQKTMRIDERQRLKEVVVPVAAPVVGSTQSEGPNEGLLIGGLVGMGVGAAGVVGFAVTGGLVVGKHSDWETKCTAGANDAECGDLQASGNSLNLANGILAGVAIAGAATGTVLLILAFQSPSAPSEAPKAALTPWAAPIGDGFMAGMSGSF